MSIPYIYICIHENIHFPFGCDLKWDNTPPNGHHENEAFREGPEAVVGSTSFFCKLVYIFLGAYRGKTVPHIALNNESGNEIMRPRTCDFPSGIQD